MFVRVLHCKATFSPLPFNTLIFWKQVTVTTSLRNEELWFISLKTVYKSFRNFLYRKDLSVLYLFNHSFISVWIHGYLFCSLGYNPILLSFIFPIFQVLAIGSCFSCLTTPLWVCWELPYFMALQKCFRLILYIPYFSLWINQSFFLKRLTVIFIEEWILSMNF